MRYYIYIYSKTAKDRYELKGSLFCGKLLLRCPKNASGFRQSSHFSTAATPFCSLHPPPAALANVPTPVARLHRSLAKSRLSIPSQPNKKCHPKGRHFLFGRG